VGASQSAVRHRRLSLSTVLCTSLLVVVWQIRGI